MMIIFFSEIIEHSVWDNSPERNLDRLLIYVAGVVVVQIFPGTEHMQKFTT